MHTSSHLQIPATGLAEAADAKSEEITPHSAQALECVLRTSPPHSLELISAQGPASTIKYAPNSTARRRS